MANLEAKEIMKTVLLSQARLKQYYEKRLLPQLKRVFTSVG